MSEPMQIALVSAVVPIIVSFAVSLAVSLYKYLVAKLPKDNQGKLNMFAQKAVVAVEQVSAAIPNDQKKAEAVRLFKALLASQNIKVSDAVIDVMIESTVFAMKQEFMNASTAKIPAITK